MRGAWCAVTHGRRHPLIVKFFAYAVSASKPPVSEEKFAPALEKNIFLTWEKNFLGEVGIFWAFQGKAVSKILLNCKSLGNYILYSNIILLLMDEQIFADRFVGNRNYLYICNPF